MYFLDLIGTFAFAITGAYKAKSRKLHIFGVIFLGLITAVGGGTFRDLIIGRTPLFYLRDQNYILVAVIGAVLTYLIPTFFKRRYTLFRLIDSIGLATFVIIGTSIAYTHLFLGSEPSVISFFSTVFLGMLTGFGGGIIRDAIMGDMPLSLKKESNYATSAFWGAFSFYVLMFFNLILAVIASMIVTLIFREIVSEYGAYRRLIKNKK
ncbi:MAG: trimeric intracellular cation channel family protein [Patescibacteria group bacterium]|nr:trimeric intracellular cation channel family protein [Patescibacteria group bacterium]